MLPAVPLGKTVEPVYVAVVSAPNVRTVTNSLWYAVVMVVLYVWTVVCVTSVVKVVVYVPFSLVVTAGTK